MKVFSQIKFIFLILFLVSFCKEDTKQVKQNFDKVTGYVSFVKGNVQIIDTNNASSEPRKAKIKDSILEKYILKTGPNSLAKVQLEGIGIIKILANSELNFELLNQGEEILISHLSGSIFSKIVKLDKKQKYNIKTITAVAGVRGTEFLSTYSDGKSTFYVKEGKVAVKKRDPNENESELNQEGTQIEKQEEKIITAGKLASVTLKQVVQVRPQNVFENLNLIKVSAATNMIEDLSKKSVKEIEKINRKEQRHQVQVTAQIEKEIEKQIKEIKLADKPIVMLVLKDGSKLKGHIMSQDQYEIKLDDGTSILTIEKKDIIRRENVKSKSK